MPTLQKIYIKACIHCTSVQQGRREDTVTVATFEAVANKELNTK